MTPVAVRCRRLARRFPAGVLLLASLLSGRTLTAQPIDRLGAIGDSLTDEYLEDSYDYARAWTEILVDERGITFGPTAVQAGQPGGTWGEPRRRGFQDNWARSGATTNDALNTGQHTGVAGGAQSRDVSHVVIYIGGNDFSPWAGAYDEIYDGAWSQGQINAWIAGRVGNVGTILDTVGATPAKIVLLGILDFSVMPWLHQGAYTDPARREAVADAVSQLGDGLRVLAQQRQLVFVDVFAFGRAVFGDNFNLRPTLTIGNVAIDLDEVDSSTGAIPTAGFVDDGVHPNTVLQALWANLILTALNQAYDTGVPLFSEQQMLATAGIAYGGVDTLDDEIGPLSEFVADYTGRTIFADGFEGGDTSAWSATVP